MSARTTLILFTPDGEEADTVSTSAQSEITLLRARGYQTKDQYKALQEAKSKAEAATKKVETATEGTGQLSPSSDSEQDGESEKPKTTRARR